MKNKKNKRLITLLLPLLLLSGVSAVTGVYAYWNLLEKTESAVVNVGEGLETFVDAKVLAPEGKELVPSGTITDRDLQVDKVELKYEVKLSKAVSAALDLTVVASEKKIGGDPTYANLVNIAIDAPTKLGGVAPQEVTVTVTITEPANETVYNAIKNKAITFRLTFTTALA